MAIETSYNFRRINDCVTTSGVVGANRLKGLAPEGYKLLINLLPDDSEYAVKDEAQTVIAQGVKYVHIPVDFNQPKVGDFERFAAALDEHQGQKTHIHCAANFRVSAFYALYAESRRLWSSAESQALIQSLWNPQDAAAWREFMAQVRTLFASA